MSPTRAEIAWAAGLFEGEGCAVVKTDKRRPNWRGPQVSLAMSDEGPVREFHRIIGFGNVTVETRAATHKTMYWWQSGSKTQVPALSVLLPWLSSRRRAAVELTITACTGVDRAESAYRGWDERRRRYGSRGRA